MKEWTEQDTKVAKAAYDGFHKAYTGFAKDLGIEKILAFEELSEEGRLTWLSSARAAIIANFMLTNELIKKAKKIQERKELIGGSI